jgi:class 3 adenylate cyclase
VEIMDSDQERLQRLDRIIWAASRERRQRLATYVRRYMSPLLIEELFAQGQLGVLMEEREISRATVIIADVRGFTPRLWTMNKGDKGFETLPSC